MSGIFCLITPVYSIVLSDFTYLIIFSVRPAKVFARYVRIMEMIVLLVRAMLKKLVIYVNASMAIIQIMFLLLLRFA